MLVGYRANDLTYLYRHLVEHLVMKQPRAFIQFVEHPNSTPLYVDCRLQDELLQLKVKEHVN